MHKQSAARKRCKMDKRVHVCMCVCVCSAARQRKTVIRSGWEKSAEWWNSLLKSRAHAKTNTKRISTSKAICQRMTVVCARNFNFSCALFLAISFLPIFLSTSLRCWYRHFTQQQLMREKKKKTNLLMLLFVNMSTDSRCLYVDMHACVLPSLRLMKWFEKP